MNSVYRKILAILSCGIFWYAGLNLFFIYSGAQQILGNPEFQHPKFISAFAVYEPLPRMSTDSWLVLKGLFITGMLMGCVLVFLNQKLKGSWIRKGFTFGLISWALVIPWFEFYLPYNVMHEPLLLVLFEGVLWLGVMMLTGICVSFILNFKNPRRV